MVSHDRSGTFSVSLKGGVRFKKRPSARNACIGGALSGKSYGGAAKGAGGRYDTRIQSAFTSAAKSCGGGGARRARRKAAPSEEY